MDHIWLKSNNVRTPEGADIKMDFVCLCVTPGRANFEILSLQLHCDPNFI